MLVLSRKRGERIRIGNDICVEVTRIGPNAVRLGITAPRDMKIVRTELWTNEGTDAEETTKPNSPGHQLQIVDGNDG